MVRNQERGILRREDIEKGGYSEGRILRREYIESLRGVNIERRKRRN